MPQYLYIVPFFAFFFVINAFFYSIHSTHVYFSCVKFWTKHRKTSDGMTGKIISVTNRTLASAYVLCHLTLLLSLFQKYRMEISNSIEEEIQEMMTREE